MTNLGWEPSTDYSLQPFITYRNDIILADQMGMIYSFNMGFAFAF